MRFAIVSYFQKNRLIAEFEPTLYESTPVPVPTGGSQDAELESTSGKTHLSDTEESSTNVMNRHERRG